MQSGSQCDEHLNKYYITLCKVIFRCAAGAHPMALQILNCCRSTLNGTFLFCFTFPRVEFRVLYSPVFVSHFLFLQYLHYVDT